jgi:hypothetical protein
MSTYTEDQLVEQPAIQLMQHELGWKVADCYDEWNGGGRLGARRSGNGLRRDATATFC